MDIDARLDIITVRLDTIISTLAAGQAQTQAQIAQLQANLLHDITSRYDALNARFDAGGNN